MMKTSYIIAAGIAITAAGWVISGQFNHTGAESQTAVEPAATAAGEPLARVRVRQQTAEPRIVEIILRGRTAANRAVELRAETRGKIVETLVERGSPVGAGDTLIRISDDDRQARLRQTKALLAQRQIEFDNAQKLAAKGYQAKTDVAESMAKLEEAKAAVASMEIDIGYTVIKAPFDGVIETRPVEIGDFVDVGDEVASLVDLDPIIVVGQVAEREVDHVKPGMTGVAALVTGEQISGTIRYVAATADEQTRTFRVELEVPNPDRRIVQGLSAELRLPVAELPAHLISPAVLTLADNGDIGVKTVGPDNIVEFHPVTVIADGPEGIWLAGLPATVTFITVGQDFVSVGQKVETVPEDIEPAS